MTAQSSDGLLFGSPTQSDAAAVASLLKACDRHNSSGDEATQSGLLVRWQRAGFELARDARVVVSNGTSLVGYASVFEGWARVEVHPAFLGRGIGSRLLEFTESRAVQQGCDEAVTGVEVTQLVRVDDSPARHLLTTRGYGSGNRHLRAESTLNGSPPKPHWPLGITVRPFAVGKDDRRVHMLTAQARGVAVTHTPRDFARWVEWIKRPTFDGSLWFLAECGEELAGVCLCRIRQGRGQISTLTVRPHWRSKGLEAALLHHAFVKLRQRGVSDVGLAVVTGNPAEAARIYRRAGMHVVGQWDRFSKALPPRRNA